ncbi:MAG TPA: hypothetical protein VIY68_19965 [Steroidobacteraceae bacterium]
MKRIQSITSMVFVAGGILLLCACSQTPVKAFAPTRFTVVDEGTQNKPDVVLVPGLTSSRESVGD